MTQMTKITNTASHAGLTFTRKGARAFSHAVLVRSSYARLKADADKMVNADLRAKQQAKAAAFEGTDGEWGVLAWAGSFELAQKAMQPFAGRFDEMLIVEATSA
jgi:hypothetical protein